MSICLCNINAAFLPRTQLLKKRMVNVLQLLAGAYCHSPERVLRFASGTAWLTG